MDGKNPLASKTLWLNLIAVAGLVLQKYYGADVVGGETAASIIAVANFVLRLITKQPITIK